MKNIFNICDHNLKILSQEEKDSSNENNLPNCIITDKKKEKLGFVNLSIENTPRYSISEWESMFNQDIRISGYISEPVLFLQFILSGKAEFIPNKNTNVIAPNGSNNLWSFNEACYGYSKQEKNIYSSSFGIYINKKFFEKLTNKYPDLLGEIYRRFTNGESFSLSPQYQCITIEIMHIISQIKQAKLLGLSSHTYTETKIAELLALQLQQNKGYKKKITNKHCKKIDDIEKIHEAKKILLTDLNHSPTLQELARKVGINENKLKYGFKEVFNQTVYGCLFDYKMDLAKKILLDTDNTILEVAIRCGYEYASHFTTAFKRKFGINPREFRNRT